MPAESERDERLFLGVPLTTDARDALSEGLPKTLPGKLVPPENWHITLRFLGQTTREQRELLTAALRKTPFPQRFTIGFTGLGAFPSPRRAKILWIGIQTGVEALAELAELAERVAASAGFTPEARAFHPHLTLARLNPPTDVSQVVVRRWRKPVLMPVSTVALFRSRLGSGPAQYEVIERFALGN